MRLPELPTKGLAPGALHRALFPAAQLARCKNLRRSAEFGGTERTDDPCTHQKQLGGSSGGGAPRPEPGRFESCDETTRHVCVCNL